MKIILASNNPHKITELKDILDPIGWEVVPQANYNVDEVEETGLSFIENAILKARHASQHTKLPALADDSGLCVAALKGAPGIYSARYSSVFGAVQTPSDASNNALLLSELGGISSDKRQASFYCALAFVQHANDPAPLVVNAQWQGIILNEARGSHGFGYDPLFFIPEQQCSAAELAPDLKNTISHRGQAMRKLLPALREHLNL